jgi:uncharacterized protein (TIGR02757 family)
VAGKTDIRRFKRSLDILYRSYDFRGRAEHDPIRVPMKFKRKRDVEAAAFLASAFAYGSVKSFLPVLDRIVSAMGSSPYEFIGGFKARQDRKLFEGIRYRFYKTGDIAGIIHVMGALINKHKSLEGVFMAHYNKEDPHIGGALSGLVEEALKVDTAPVYGRNIKTRGLMFAFPSPRKGSTCKRHNLFLRWMVRNKDIDFGLWRDVVPSKLIIPLDTHIGRVSRCLGFTERKANDWKTAVEITASLKALDPEDPLKYDFALCHRGIAGLCEKNRCEECELWKN